MVEINHISKKFGDFEALNDVSFHVHNGEIVGLLGENGAGKSTLLRIISTIIKPTSGDVRINGIELKKDPASIRASIGILFGTEVGFYGNLTAKDNLYYFARLNGLTKKQAVDRIDDLACQFEFRAYLNKEVDNLSKGMKQKLAIARSIIHDPDIMLFDEPDSGLDFISAKTIFDFISLCKKRGKAIIFSCHSMENIKRISDRVVILNKGSLVNSFSTREYLAKYTDKEIDELLFNLVCHHSEEKK